jgi:chromosome segregation ATPase
MFAHIFQIVFMLGVTAFFVWLYYRIQLMGIERDKKTIADNFSELRIKYSSLLTRYTKVEDDMIKLKSESQEIVRQQRSTESQVQDLLIAEETYKLTLSHLESYKRKHDEQLSKMRETEMKTDTLQLALKKLEREKNDAQTELNKQQTTIENQQRTIGELVAIRNEHNLLKSEYQHNQGEALILSEKVRQLNIEKTQLLERVKENALQISTLQANLLSLESIKERYDKLFQISEQYKARVSELSQDLLNARNTIAQLEGRISKSELQEIMQQQTHTVLEEIRSQYKVLMPQYQKLETEMQDLQDKITHLMSLPIEFQLQ